MITRFVEASKYFAAIKMIYVISNNYNFSKKWSFGIAIENLFDVDWNETQFATETRLFNELQPVEEITFTPGTPFFMRAKLLVTF